MELTIENVYSYLEENKHKLNFIPRDDVETDMGISKFSTLFWDSERKDMPDELKNLVVKLFKVSEKDYSFLQIQKYEIGDYILPHKDPYPCFGLLNLSSSTLDGLTVEKKERYEFIPDIAGQIIDVPRYAWHWVNPVREKTRYSAVYGLDGLTNLECILDV